MKNYTVQSFLYLLIFAFITSTNSCTTGISKQNSSIDRSEQKEISVKSQKKLRHVVLFKFKADASNDDIVKVEEAFNALPSKIPEIKDFEWGTNNSPEGLDKGFTHCFFLTFDSEEGRAIYLPHPDHKSFGSMLRPYLEDVLVLDYWIK